MPSSSFCCTTCEWGNFGYRSVFLGLHENTIFQLILLTHTEKAVISAMEDWPVRGQYTSAIDKPRRISRVNIGIFSPHLLRGVSTTRYIFPVHCACAMTHLTECQLLRFRIDSEATRRPLVFRSALLVRRRVVVNGVRLAQVATVSASMFLEMRKGFIPIFC